MRRRRRWYQLVPPSTQRVARATARSSRRRCSSSVSADVLDLQVSDRHERRPLVPIDVRRAVGAIPPAAKVGPISQPHLVPGLAAVDRGMIHLVLDQLALFVEPIGRGGVIYLAEVLVNLLFWLDLLLGLDLLTCS